MLLSHVIDVQLEGLAPLVWKLCTYARGLVGSDRCDNEGGEEGKKKGMM
jgi:hypothetical protein